MSFGPQNRFSVNEGREINEELPNIVFAYEEAGGASGEAVYVEIEGQPHLTVRALHARALLGSGMFLESNKNRVYVLDSSIPCEHQTIKRGYLKVQVVQVSPKTLISPLTSGLVTLSGARASEQVITTRSVRPRSQTSKRWTTLT